MDAANALGYAFLFYPMTAGWPAELDIAEDGGGKRTKPMSTLHHTSNNLQVRGYTWTDFTQWHTMSVVWDPDRMEILRDGKSVTVFTGSKVPRQKMWLGLQGLNKKCSGVYGNCPFGSYPSTAKIEIDWVAHRRRA